jgi:hypothetical protein
VLAIYMRAVLNGSLNIPGPGSSNISPAAGSRGPHLRRLHGLLSARDATSTAQRAPGLTPRAVLDKMAEVQMLDVHFPTTDDRTLILSRYTEPTREHKVLLQQLNLMLPPQPPPRITAARAIARSSQSVM